MTRFCLSFVVCLALRAQAPMVDRGLPAATLNRAAGEQRVNVRFEWNQHNQGFVGDEFQVGTPGEVWVIDRMRTWAVPGTAAGDPEFLGDRFEKVTLFGGLEGGSLQPLKIATLTPGSSAAGSPGVTFTPVEYETGAVYDDFGSSLRIWQVEFDNLNWSVAGGATVQFGVMGTGRAAGQGQYYPWFNHASHDGRSNRLRMINADGTLAAYFDSQGKVWDKPSRINVQVWGHLAARVALRQVGNGLEVALYGAPGFDINAVHTASLRLGPKAAQPVSTRLDDANGDGTIDLLARFTSAATGLSADDPKACLSGQRLDGAAFQGCGALAVVK